jgi:sugar phosphate isomerase/epimerase
VRIGVFDDGLAGLDRRGTFAWCAERGLTAIEMGVGGWGLARNLPLDALLRDAAARDALLGELREHGLALSCVNAAGNPLHPDPVVGDDHRARLRGAVELAAALGVTRVVTMSGCPAGPGGGAIGVFASWPLNADHEDLLRWQWREAVEPFWRETSRWAAAVAPAVGICLELHPGCWAFNPQTFLDLRTATGPNVMVNLDPSHFWWQGIDPEAAIDALSGHIGFAHAKDTLLFPDRIRARGVFDVRYPIDPATAPWTFAAVGRGHADETWGALIEALRRAGHDGDLSIEHEDPTLDASDGLEHSLATLRRVLREG